MNEKIILMRCKSTLFSSFPSCDVIVFLVLVTSLGALLYDKVDVSILQPRNLLLKKSNFHLELGITILEIENVDKSSVNFLKIIYSTIAVTSFIEDFKHYLNQRQHTKVSIK